MKSITLKTLFLAVIVISASASQAIAQSVMTTSNETYLGAVSYPGGLMERSGLRLSSLTDIRYLRVEMPSFCSGDVFEVGYVSGGAYLTAEKVGHNLFSVNSGRGVLADGIYLSINGPQSNACSVLVFKVENSTPAPTPPPATEYAFTCLTNATRVAIPTNVSTPSGTTQGFVQPGQTVIISQPTLPGRIIPNMTISFDADASLGYYPVSVSVASVILPAGNCQYAPLYQYVEDVTLRRLNVVRLH